MAGIYFLTDKGAAAIGDGDDDRTDSVPDPAMMTAAIPRSVADIASELQKARHRAEVGDEPPF